MKALFASLCLLATACAQASLTWESQTFSPDITIPAGNPTGVEVSGNFTEAPAGYEVLGITVELNISGGYNGNLAAYLVAPNGTVVTLMNEPGVGVDGFGASSSGMDITLSDAGSTSIQSVTGGSGILMGTYQADQTLGTFDNSVADGTWDIYFADLRSGGGNPTLNSFTLDIAVPEPVTLALPIFGALLLGWTGFRWAMRAMRAKRRYLA